MRLLNMAPTKDSVAEKNQSDSKRGCCERGGWTSEVGDYSLFIKKV